MLGRKSVPAHFWHWNLFVFHWMTTKGNDDHSISSNQEKVTDLWPQLTTRGGWARSNHLKQSEAARPGWKEVMKRGGGGEHDQRIDGCRCSINLCLDRGLQHLEWRDEEDNDKKKNRSTSTTSVLYFNLVVMWWNSLTALSVWHHSRSV